MKINKKLSVNTDLNNNIQNNQKKEFLSNINKNIRLNKVCKRYMFTKGSVVLKRSGEIITDAKIQNNIIINIPINTPKSPRLTLDSLIIPKFQNRNLALYNKLNKDNTVISYEGLDTKPIITFNFNEQIKLKTEEGNLLLLKNKITKYQFDAFFKRLNALSVSYVHTVVLEIVYQDDLTVICIYYVITTTPTGVDYGGVNKFDPSFLCYDAVKNKSFYSLPLMYKQLFSKEEFANIFKFKKKSEFKDDIELQKKIIDSLIKVEKEHGNFRQLDVNLECINKSIRDIDPNELFPKKEEHYKITHWEEHIFE